MAEFDFKGKIKVHLYHTNQTVLIQGDAHDDFFCKFFSPMIDELCQGKAEQIKRFNTIIINSMKPGPHCPDLERSPARGLE